MDNHTTDGCHLSRTPAVFLGHCVARIAHDLFSLTQRRIELVRIRYRRSCWSQIMWLWYIRATCNATTEVIQAKHNWNESEMNVTFRKYFSPVFLVFKKTMSCGLQWMIYCVCNSQFVALLSIASLNDHSLNESVLTYDFVLSKWQRQSNIVCGAV